MSNLINTGRYSYYYNMDKFINKKEIHMSNLPNYSKFLLL